MYSRTGSLFVLALTLAGCGVAASPPSSGPTTAPTATAGQAPTASPSAAPTAGPTATPTSAPTATATPAATTGATPTAAGLLPPSGIYVSQDSRDYSDGSFTLTTTLTWANPRTPGATVAVYGLNKCLATTEGAPCATDGMSLPKSNLLPLASVPASDGLASWSYWAPEGASYYCGAVGVVADKGETAKLEDWYWAVVLRSEDASGTSPFVVAQTSKNEDVTC